MASKFVKQQKRRRWAETGVIFSLKYAEEVEMSLTPRLNADHGVQ